MESGTGCCLYWTEIHSLFRVIYPLMRYVMWTNRQNYKKISTNVEPVALRSNTCHGLLIHEVCRLHTTHHNQYDPSGRVISPSQRPLPDNTQHSQQTNIHALGGIRTHNLRRRAAADPRLSPCGPWDRHQYWIESVKFCMCPKHQDEGTWVIYFFFMNAGSGLQNYSTKCSCSRKRIPFLTLLSQSRLQHAHALFTLYWSPNCT